MEGGVGGGGANGIRLGRRRPKLPRTRRARPHRPPRGNRAPNPNRPAPPLGVPDPKWHSDFWLCALVFLPRITHSAAPSSGLPGSLATPAHIPPRTPPSPIIPSQVPTSTDHAPANHKAGSSPPA